MIPTTRTKMMNVHLYFLKLFGCMICEAKANGYDVPIDISPFSTAIMSGRPHSEVYLQFGKYDDGVGRSDLKCWTTKWGVLAGWLYKLVPIAVSVMFAQADGWDPVRLQHQSHSWHLFFSPLRRDNLGRDFVPCTSVPFTCLQISTQCADLYPSVRMLDTNEEPRRPVVSGERPGLKLVGHLIDRAGMVTLRLGSCAAGRR
jgi:hypothetical protein